MILFHQRHPEQSFRNCSGGDDGIRTHDPLLAGQVLSQLSYTPIFSSSLPSFPSLPTLGFLPSIPTVFSFSQVPSKLNNIKTFLIPPISKSVCQSAAVLLRKEVIQPHLPIRLPCYDLTPIIESTFGCCLLAVSSQTSGVPDFHGLTGGVYKARERIHRSMLIYDY